MTLKRAIAAALCYACAAPFTFAQQATIAPERPTKTVLLRDYFPATVPPVRFDDSNRLHELIRAGRLYLTAQDAITLALENNLDIEIARYNESSLQWRLERSQAGGTLPGVPSNASQTSSTTNGQGVLGSQAAAGVGSGGGGNGGRNTANATITQVGPVVQTFDPSIQEATTFSHRSLPQANARVSVTSVLVQNQRVYTGSYQQGLVTGGSVNVSYNNRYLNENAPTDVLNPSLAPTFSVSLQHNLLQGFGKKLNLRNIEVAKANLGMSDVNFRSQVTGVVVNVLNNYWALAGAYEDLKAKESTLATAQLFYDENKQRVALGALAPVDLPSSESQIAASQQNLVNAQATVKQRELNIKGLISRKGLSDPLLMSARIVPLDRITISDKDDIESVKDLITKAYSHRSDLLAQKETLRTSDISNLGTQNGILPSVQAFATVSNAGLAGVPRIVPGQPAADSRLVGGLHDALGQIIQFAYSSRTAGIFGSARLHNRQAQADLGIDQLQSRQQEWNYQKDLNQAQVDVSNSVIALSQSRARYDAAKENRVLAEQLLDAEQQKFKLGESTSYNVVVQQRDLATAQSNEIAALVSYQNARTNLDQTVGLTLEANNISLAEAKAGRIARTSAPPPQQ